MCQVPAPPPDEDAEALQKWREENDNKVSLMAKAIREHSGGATEWAERTLAESMKLSAEINAFDQQLKTQSK